MKQNEQEMMERYIYQVARRLPKEQRQEVGMELRELIGDMAEQAGSLERALEELGDPAVFAGKYRDDAYFLIGPEYYSTWLWFVKVVLLCTLIPICAISLIEGIGKGLAGGLDYGNIVSATVSGLTDAIVNSLISGIGAFGGVTLVFAVLERQKVKLDLKLEKTWSVHELEPGARDEKKAWTPKALTPIPDKKSLISRGDSIVGIVFTVIFCVLLIFFPHFFSIVLKTKDGMATVPLFHLEQWNQVLPVLAASLFLGLADEILRLIEGVYCRAVMVSGIVSGVLQMVLLTVTFKVLPFWNPNFSEELKFYLDGEKERAIHVLTGWDADMLSNWVLAFCAVITLIEIGVTVYRTLRYGGGCKNGRRKERDASDEN